MANNIFDKVVGSHKDIYTVIDNKEIKLAEAVKTAQVNFHDVILYKIDVLSGTASAFHADLRYEHTNTAKFVKAYTNFWYYQQEAQLSAIDLKISSAEIITDEDGELKEIAKARIEYARKALESYKGADVFKSTPYTIRLLVYSDIGMKAKYYPTELQEGYNKIKSVLNKMSGFEDDSKEYADCMKELKKTISEEFYSKIWVTTWKKKTKPTEEENKNECIAVYTANANMSMVRNVVEVYYKGRIRSKGNFRIEKSYNKDEVVMKEIIYECFQKLQKPEVKIEK